MKQREEMLVLHNCRMIYFTWRRKDAEKMSSLLFEYVKFHPIIQQCRNFDYHLSTVNCQLSTVNCQLSTVNCQPSTVNLFPKSHTEFYDIAKAYPVI